MLAIGQSQPTGGARLCPACAAEELLASDLPVWPAGWQCKSCDYAVPVNEGFPLFAPELASAETGFTTAAFDQLARREAGHFWFEPRSRLLAGLAARYFPAATRYLEIGCGTGVVLTALAAARSWSRLAGSELHPAGLAYARQRLGSRAEFVQMDARRIPARQAFDLIGAFDVLEHIVEDGAVIREVHAALAPGGGFIAAVPQHPALWSRTDDVAHHVRRYRRHELEAKLRAARFEILFSSSYASVVLPIMVASRFTARSSQRAAAHCELAVHPILNRILRRALNAEVSLTLQGLRWPIGGSRVVVARKPSK